MSTIQQSYASQCDECGRQVRRHLELTANKVVPPYARVFCAECRNIVRCAPEDNGREV